MICRPTLQYGGNRFVYNATNVSSVLKSSCVGGTDKNLYFLAVLLCTRHYLLFESATIPGLFISGGVQNDATNLQMPRRIGIVQPEKLLDASARLSRSRQAAARAICGSDGGEIHRQRKTEVAVFKRE